MTKLEALKCVEVTSQTQANNGTVCYHDPITGCDYMSYKSGYIRRSYITRDWRSGRAFRTIYQLNPTRKGYQKSEYNGHIYEVTTRVMIHDPNERLERLARAVANYRKTAKKNAEWRKKYNVLIAVSDEIEQYYQGNLTVDMSINGIKELINGL